MAAKQIDEKLLLRIYDEGKTIQEIADIIGVSTTAINDVIKKNNNVSVLFDTDHDRFKYR